MRNIPEIAMIGAKPGVVNGFSNLDFNPKLKNIKSKIKSSKEQLLVFEL